MKRLIVFWALFLIIMASPASIFAHKVSVFTYVEGDVVYAECFFSDGTPVKNAIVDVFDSAGRRLLSGKTDKNGIFSFKVPKKDDLRIVLNASMGHRAEMVIQAKELPELLKPKPQGRPVPAVDIDQIRQVVEEAVSREVRPLMRAIAQQQARRVSVTEVVGGIGYIVGLMGIWMYLRSRKGRK